MKKSLGAVLAALFVLVVAGPVVWTMLASVKSGSEIFSSPWSLPSSLRFDNFGRAWTDASFGSYFLRSLIVTAATMALLLPIGSMAAYVLAKYPFRGSKLIFGTFLGGLMFPNILAAVPLEMLCRQSGLANTLHGLVIVYVAYSLSFTVFVMHGFYSALPDELAEAATLDGCGHQATFWKVMWPLARPGLIVVGIFNAIGIWNEYNLAKILLQKENYTLPLGLANLTSQQSYRADWGALFAGVVIVMLPVMAVYWIFRDKIQQAMLAGAIK